MSAFNLEDKHRLGNLYACSVGQEPHTGRTPKTSLLWGLHASPTIVLYAPGLQNNLSFQEPQKIKK